MSEDPSRNDRDDEPRSTPFPESSLSASRHEDAVPPSDPPYGHPHPPGLVGDGTQQADPPPGSDPVADPPHAPEHPPLGERWASSPSAPGPGAHAPQAPPPPGPTTPQPGAGFTHGDPLGGSATPGFAHGDPLGAAPATSSPPSYPGGYTSPPPPGAGGTWPPPSSPAPGTGTLVLSGWWRRAGAAIIDGFIILAAAALIMAPLGIGLFSAGEGDGSGVFGWVAAFMAGMLVIALVALLYAPVMMGATNGRTVGRMVTGIRVVRANGQPMTFGYAALREIAVKVLLINTIAGSFTFGLAGLLDVLWPLWDDENRALHDFVVDTRTVLA